MFFDDAPRDYLANLRLSRQLVPLPCPQCRVVLTGLSEAHARDVLAIHQEGTCEGGGDIEPQRQ